MTLSACDPGAVMSARGFRLPDGDAQAGREAFLYMQCHQCHTLKGETLPVVPGENPPYVELGGQVTQVKTYGQLVTSIINPSHKLATGYAKEVVSEGGESNMYIYNQHMTVQELIDIVMFLQPYYDVVVPEFRYPVYP
ncbi:MAG: c-type cytochrome [Gammaproteobacteria bacterium]|nr:c-type cytochrome [Gammaproteobacteria bacterium]